MSKAAEVLDAAKAVLEKLEDSDVRLALMQKLVEVLNSADAAKMTPEQLMEKLMPPKPPPATPPMDEKKPDPAVDAPAKAADPAMCDGCKKPMADCTCAKSADKSNADLQKNVATLQKSVDSLTAKVAELTKAATTTTPAVEVKKSIWPAEL